MREVDFNIYKKLSVDGSISKSVISKSVFKSNSFQNLLDAEILEITKVGRGLKVIVNKKTDFGNFFKTNFPRYFFRLYKKQQKCTGRFKNKFRHLKNNQKQIRRSSSCGRGLWGKQQGNHESN